MTKIQVYIPRMLPDVSKETILFAFLTGNLGFASFIEIHTRVNARKQYYSFAFVDIELIDTKEAKELQTKIENNESILFSYNQNFPCLFWILKPRLSKSATSSPSISRSSSPMNMIESPKYSSSKKRILKELKKEENEEFDYFNSEMKKYKEDFQKQFYLDHYNDSFKCSVIDKESFRRQMKHLYDMKHRELNTMFSSPKFELKMHPQYNRMKTRNAPRNPPMLLKKF